MREIQKLCHSAGFGPFLIKSVRIKSSKVPITQPKFCEVKLAKPSKPSKLATAEC